MTDLLAAYRHSSRNQAEIEASKLCGCFNCIQTFPPEEIIAWGGLDAASFDDPDALAALNGTALCPRCGGETVIGDQSGFAIDLEFLREMNEAWCQRTIIRPKKPNP